MTDTHEPLERRPLKTRATAWANALARLVAKTGISPNGISVVGLVAGVAAGVALAMTSRVEDAATVRGLWILGAALVQLRLLSNLLDGMVAVVNPGRPETQSPSPDGSPCGYGL